INGDVSMQSRSIPFEAYPLLIENQVRDGEAVYDIEHWLYGAGTPTIIYFNQNNPDEPLGTLMKDRRFRRALSLAIDR
ncbi:hypothetical protein R0K19_28135, partial [Bacillus sp. SIMBA_161]